MRRPLTQVVIIFIVATMAVILSLPIGSAFEGNSDAALSATGMALARSFHRYPDLPNRSMGFGLNGEFAVYTNWPPMHFRLLSEWFYLLRGIDVFKARILSALVYGVTATLLFLFLNWKKINRKAAMLTTLLFIFLPVHLTYGKLIYSDIWLSIFWILGCFLIQPNTLKRFWLFLILMLLGTVFFMWFIAFLIPVPLIMFFHQKYSWKGSIGVFVATLLIGYAVQYALIYKFEGTYIITNLESWSILNLNQDFSFNFAKRLATLGFESIPIILFGLFLLRKLSFRQLLREFKNTKIYFYIKAIALALLIYVCLMPVWFVTHLHGIAMFSLLISMVFAGLLNVLESVDSARVVPNGKWAIISTMVLFTAFHLIPKGGQHYQDISGGMAEFINDSSKEDEKVCVFFSLNNFKGWTHPFEFAVKEQSSSFIFNRTYMEHHPDLDSAIVGGLTKLEARVVSGFDSEKVIVVSQSDHLNTSYQITKAKQFEDIYMYELRLKP